MRYAKLMGTLLAALALSGNAIADADADALKAKQAALQAEQPGLFAREIAQKLGVSEAKLLAADIGRGATLLRSDVATYKTLFNRMHELGRIKAITRNENGVIERTAVALAPKLDDQGRVKPGSGFVGTDIDLRFKMDSWGYAFAVVAPRAGGRTSRSLQFFAKNGEAIHKVYLNDEKGVPAFEKLVAEFKAADQKPDWTVVTEKPVKPLTDMNIKELRSAWFEMTDVHEFQRLINDFGISRERAFELIGTDAAYKITGKSVETLLETASKRQQPIMVFVSNQGMVQIYSGLIEKTEAKNGWFNVLDPDFDLHLRQSGVDHGWVVRRPAKSGTITSVEFYDTKGEQVVNFFSRRDPGKEETKIWRDIVANLPHLK